jgi:DNA-binding GntR family transcriptional regulator
VSAEPTVAGGLEASSLVELAVRRLRSEILSGTLAPGERLVEEQLTRRFGTSRAPLREALRLLGEQGLVEHLPRRGVRVAELSERDIEELFSLRGVLEEFAVRTAFGGGALPDLGGLRAAVEDMERAAGEGAGLEQAASARAGRLPRYARALQPAHGQEPSGREKHIGAASMPPSTASRARPGT